MNVEYYNFNYDEKTKKINVTTPMGKEFILIWSSNNPPTERDRTIIMEMYGRISTTYGLEKCIHLEREYKRKQVEEKIKNWKPYDYQKDTKYMDQLHRRLALTTLDRDIQYC
jgi:hypothetical protein